MFITRKQYEKNIRKAKKKAKKELAFQIGIQREMEDMRKSQYETANILREESDRRCRAIEKDIAKIKKEVGIE